ncbi:hypothetical protein Vadar_005627 [Vaccinium darrowii]|uniref:Uncharacterized protein n=1 Tax=Vaccinium darrowii TaxID=229202 RepID=A0ACB7WXY3_9ERIC|nr:hypothetical protein Vadar_005627 [Vaccinium darrowii]
MGNQGSRLALSSLDTPLAAVSVLPPLPDYAEPAKTKITTLPNGIKIASETSLVCLPLLVIIAIFVVFIQDAIGCDLVSESESHSLCRIVLSGFIEEIKWGHFGTISENCTAPRMVLAASGAEHEELLSLAEPLLSDLPSVPRPDYPESVYVGGQYRHEADSGDTHFILAVEVPGGLQNEKEAVSLMILQMLVGSSFTDEYQRRLQSFSAFNSLFRKIGIFGIHATAVKQLYHIQNYLLSHASGAFLEGCG